MTNTEQRFSDVFHSQVPPEYRTDTPVMADAFTQMQCDWYNQSTGSLTDGVDCPECKNRGYFQVVGSEGFPVLRECKCMRERRYYREMQSSGLGDLFKQCTFDAYNVEEEWQKACKQAAMRYARDDGNGWFFIAGQTGCGKTHLCTAICSELAKRGRSIMYIKWKIILQQLERTRFEDSGRDEIVNLIRSADVLYLDDFLKTPKNAAPAEQIVAYAFDIVDIRYASDKKTIFSAEFTLPEIGQFDEALAGRIFEKSQGSVLKIGKAECRNYRRRRKARTK